MKYTFRGGSHVDEHKHTSGCAIERMPAPRFVSIPLSQHIGVPCTPLVSVGDTVTRGQLIGEVTDKLGSPVHSSVSGKVVEIVSRNNAAGRPIMNIRIENDGLDTLCPDIKPFEKDIKDTTTEEIIEIIRASGISGMGGATFPTYAKIQSALGKVDKLIVNCAECEPFITANHRLMLEFPERILGGAKILLKALGLRRAEIAVEDNKGDAIKLLTKEVGDSDLLAVRVCKTKYPQGDERQLIYALTGRVIPAGKLPADVGCVVFNAETCAAIYCAFAYGLPLIKRIVTVDGDCIKTPKNVLVPIGTSYSDLINFCGGLVHTPYKIVNGGPMMGAAQWDIHAPVTKGTSAILVFSGFFENKYEQPISCIHCGRCVANCPMHLMPNYLYSFAKSGDYDNAGKYNVMSCVECGTCSYNCPGGCDIVQYIRVAKGAIRAKSRR